MTQQIDFYYDKVVVSINRKIRKDYGASCNCFLSWDLEDKKYRLSFMEMFNRKKRTPSQIPNGDLNLLFFNNPMGVLFKDGVSQKELKIYVTQQLNYFPERKNFLLSLTEILMRDLRMYQTEAIEEVVKWQNCLLCAASDKENSVTLIFDERHLNNLYNKENLLWKLTCSLETHTKGYCNYKILEIDDINNFGNVLLLYE